MFPENASEEAYILWQGQKSGHNALLWHPPSSPEGAADTISS
jgi:hypothetical protein